MCHGTVAVVADPHEIANVLGIAGIDFMIESGQQVPLKFYFGTPSCVPATAFESTGTRLTAHDVAELPVAGLLDLGSCEEMAASYSGH